MNLLRLCVFHRFINRSGSGISPAEHSFSKEPPPPGTLCESKGKMGMPMTGSSHREQTDVEFFNSPSCGNFFFTGIFPLNTDVDADVEADVKADVEADV